MNLFLEKNSYSKFETNIPAIPNWQSGKVEDLNEIFRSELNILLFSPEVALAQLTNWQPLVWNDFLLMPLIKAR